MDFVFSEEEQAFSDLSQQIFEDKVTHEHLRSLAKSGSSFDRDLWASLASTGVVGATIDEQFGGSSLSFWALRHCWKTLGNMLPRYQC